MLDTHCECGPNKQIVIATVKLNAQIARKLYFFSHRYVFVCLGIFLSFSFSLFQLGLFVCFFSFTHFRSSKMNWNYLESFRVSFGFHFRIANERLQCNCFEKGFRVLDFCGLTPFFLWRFCACVCVWESWKLFRPICHIKRPTLCIFVYVSILFNLFSPFSSLSVGFLFHFIPFILL